MFNPYHCSVLLQAKMVMKRFPNVVGCDLYRAKCMIRCALPHCALQFRVVPYVFNRKMAIVSRHANEVVLFYDEKFDAVAVTPCVWAFEEMD